MGDELKQKKFYSLNLTEGRVLIIFICIILFITILAFCITFLFFSKSRANEIKIKTTEASDLVDNSKKDYYSLANESDENLIEKKSADMEDEKPEELNLEKNSSAEKIGIEENTNGSEPGKVIQKLEIEPDDKNAVKNENQGVTTDDSEIIYSSKYSAKKTNYDYKPGTKQKTNNSEKVKPQKKEISKNYIVQIGSYSNKKTAEQVSGFYQKLGYSPYIVTKDVNGKTFFRLRIGPFKEKDQAVKHLNDLKKSKFGDDSYLSVVYI